MGYSIVGKYIPGKVQTFRRFICDTTADVPALPINVAFGSEAFCVEDGLTYILQNNGNWVEKTEGEGGGNPNYIETIEGTLENPWGSYTFSDITNMLYSNNETIELNVQGGAFTNAPFLVGGYAPADITFINLVGVDTDLLSGFFVIYTKGSGLASFGEWYGEVGEPFEVTDMMAEAGDYTTTLTIIHHPMPETNG